MTTHHHKIDEDEIQAFVDGHLPPERRRAVMAYLAADPEDAARMSEYRALNEALHLLYDEVLHEPLPERLKAERYLGRVSWLDRCRGWIGTGMHGLVPQLAGLALVVLVSGGSGWWLHGQVYKPEVETPAMSFARQAANAHLVFAPELRHPVEFSAEEQDSLLLWLSERLGQAVRAPNLQQIGYGLVGGRLLPASGQPAAQLMYEDATSAKRITLYIRGRWGAAEGPHLSKVQEGTVSYAGEGGISMVYWIDGPLAYALIGELDREQLFATASTIQQQLQLPGLPAPTPTTDQTAEKNAT